MHYFFPRHFALSSCNLLLSLQFHKFCNSFNFDGCSLSMSKDDSDGGESSMRVLHPPTLEPPKPCMLRFCHMEQGNEKEDCAS